jgi:hypothetical protein
MHVAVAVTVIEVGALAVLLQRYSGRTVPRTPHDNFAARVAPVLSMPWSQYCSLKTISVLAAMLCYFPAKHTVLSETSAFADHNVRPVFGAFAALPTC